MLKFIGRRLVQIALLFLAYLTFIFFLLQAQPGDVTDQFIGNPSIPPEVRAQLAERLGLDKSVWEQYIAYIGNFFQGDLGLSFTRYPQRGLGPPLGGIAPDHRPLPQRHPPRLRARVLTGQSRGLAAWPGNRDRNHRWRGPPLHGLLSMVRHHDALVVRLHTRMVPHRPVHHDRGMERLPLPGQPGLRDHDPLGADRQRALRADRLVGVQK